MKLGYGLAAALALAACHHTPPAPVTTMQYNVAQLGPGPQGERVVMDIAARAPDFVAAEECTHCDWLASQLPGYKLTQAGPADVGLLYDSARWTFHEGGVFNLGNDDDGWGQRVTRWGRFESSDGAALYVYATHWCVTIRSPNDACDAARHVDYARTTIDAMGLRDHLDEPVILAGDFNVFDGYAADASLKTLEAAGLVDTVGPVADPVTFSGNSWAPAGEIDYVLAQAPVEVLDAWIDRTVPLGAGSDHFAVVATTSF